MLGEVLRNPFGAEGEVKEISGFGLLEGETIFYPEKITSQVIARPLDHTSTYTLWGYEIHKGITLAPHNLFQIWRYATGETLTEGQRKGSVWGTYLHGLFTNDKFRRDYLNLLREKKGLKPLEDTESYWEVVNRNLDLLAERLEKYVDLKRIRQILDL